MASTTKAPQAPAETASHTVPYVMTNQPAGLLPDMSGFTWQRAGSVETGWSSICPIQGGRDLVKGETLSALLVNLIDGEMTNWRFTPEDQDLSVAKWPEAFAASIAKSGLSMTAGQWHDGVFEAKGEALRLWNHAKFRSFTTAPFAGNLVQALACNDAFELASGRTLSLQVRDLNTQHLYEQHFFTPDDTQTGQAWSEALCKQVNLASQLIRAGVLDAACTVTPAATANAFWVPQCSELCLTLNECHWWAAREFTAAQPLAENESIAVQVYDAFSHRLVDQFVWTPESEQRAVDKWPSAWAEAVKGSSVEQWLHVGGSSTPGSAEVASGSSQATLWHRGEAVRICTSLPDTDNWLPGPKLDEAWGDASDAVMFTVRHRANQKLLHLDVFTPETGATAAKDQDGWLSALESYANGRQWPLIRVAHEDSNGQLDSTAGASGPRRVWCARFAEVAPQLQNVGTAEKWKSSRYPDYLLPTDDLPNKSAPTRFVNAVLDMKTQFSRRRACIVVAWLMGDLEFRLSQAAIDKGYSIADCARTEARDGMLSYHTENTQVPVEVSAERIVWRGRVKNSVYEVLLDYPESACDATELVLGYAGVFTEGLFWQGVQSASFTPPAAPAAYIPTSPLCEDYGNTFRSEVFDVSGQSETGVDRRTGLFHAHYPVATLHGLEGLGPVCDLTMHYSALRGNEAGLGDGWAWRFASLEHRDRRLIMADGVQVDFTDSEWSNLAKGQSLIKNQCVIRSNADYSEFTLNLPSGRQEILSKPSAEGSDEEEPNDALRKEILRLLRAIKNKSKPEFPQKPTGFQQWALAIILPVGYVAGAALDWNGALSAWKDRTAELDQQIAYYQRTFVQLLPSRIVSLHGQALTLTWKRQKGQFLLQAVKSGSTSLFDATYTATEATFDIWKSSAADRCTVRLELANYLLQKVQRCQGNDTSALLHEAQYGYSADPTLDRVLNQVRELDGSSEFVRYTPKAFTFSDKRPALPAVQQHVIIPDRNQQSIVSDYAYVGSYLRDEYFACGVTTWVGGDSSADFHVFDRTGRQLAHGDAAEEMITVSTEPLGRSLIKYPVFHTGQVRHRVGQRVHALLMACSRTVAASDGGETERLLAKRRRDESDPFDDDFDPNPHDKRSTEYSALVATQIESDLAWDVHEVLTTHGLTFEELRKDVVVLLASCIIDPLRQQAMLTATSTTEALLVAMESVDWDDFFRRYKFSAPLLGFMQGLNFSTHAERRAASKIHVTDNDTELATLNQSCKCDDQNQVVYLRATDGCQTYSAYYAKGVNSIVCPLVTGLPVLECPDIPAGVPAPLMAEYQCDAFGNPLGLTLYGYRSVARNDRRVLETAHKVVIEGVSAAIVDGVLDATTQFSLADESKPALVRCSSTTSTPVANKTEKPDCKVRVWSLTDKQKISLGEDVMETVTVQSFEDNPTAVGIQICTKVSTSAGTALLKEEVRSRLTHRCSQRLQDGIEEHFQYDALARVVEHKRYRLKAGTKADKKSQKPEQMLSTLYSSDSKLETVTQLSGEQVRNHKDGLGRTVSIEWRPHDKASFVPMSEQQFFGIESVQVSWGSSWDYLPGGLAISTSTMENKMPGQTPWHKQIEGPETIIEYGLGERLRARHRQHTKQLDDGGFQRSDIQEDAQGQILMQIQRQYDGNGDLVALERTVDEASSKTTLLRDALGRVTKMTRPDGSVVERTYKGFSTQVVELTVDSAVIATQELDLPSTLTARTVGTRRYALGHDQVTLPDQTVLSFAESGNTTTYQASDVPLSQLTFDRKKVVFAAGLPVKAQATPSKAADSNAQTSKAQATKAADVASPAEGWRHAITPAKLPGALHVEESGPRTVARRLHWQSLRGETIATRLADGHMLRRFDDRWGRPLRTCRDHEDVRFIHDEFGNLTSRHVHALGGGGQWQVGSQYDAFDQETCRIFRRNDSMTFEQRFTWKSGGMLKTKESGTWRRVLRTEAFEYDALDRLKQYSCAGSSEHLPQDITGQPVKLQVFSWSALSNMTQCVTTYSDDTTSTRDFSYSDNDPTRLTSVQHGADTKSLAWDSNGNMVTDAEGRALVYTPDGRLKQVSDDQQKLLTRYNYDGHDRLVAQYVAADESTRELRYNGSELIGEIWYDKLGKPSRELSFSPGLATYDDAKVRWLIDDPQSGVVGEVRDGILIVNALLPFGEAPDAKALTIAYNGMRRDPVTGHYHGGNGYRCYDPTLGRYLQPDWLSPFAEGGLNEYVHCPDPVNWHDPTGAIMMSRWGQMRTLESLEQFLSDVQPMPVGSRWRDLAMSAVLTVLGIASVVMSGGATSAWVIAALTALNLASFGLEFASEMLKPTHPDLARKLGIASGIAGVLSIGNPMGILKLLGRGLRSSALFGMRVIRRVGLTMLRARQAFRLTRLRGFKAGRRAWRTAPNVPKVISGNYAFDSLGEPKMRGFNVVRRTTGEVGPRVHATSSESRIGDFTLADQFEIVRGWKADFLWFGQIGAKAGRLVYEAADLYTDIDDLVDGADLVLPEDMKISGGNSLKGRMAKFKIDVRDGQKAGRPIWERSTALIGPGSN